MLAVEVQDTLRTASITDAKWRLKGGFPEVILEKTCRTMRRC